MKKIELPNGIRIILVDDISPEDVAMVQALYSRNASSAEVHLQRVHDELWGLPRGQATQRTAKFMNNYVVGYGHKSIADCGSTTLFFEGVSMLAAKAIQDWPLYSGQETSTRYLSMAGRHVIDPIGNACSQEIIERWLRFYEKGLPRVKEEVRKRYPKKQDEKDSVYQKAVAARSFDVMRGFLPAGMTTQLSWHTNLRQASDHLAWLAQHPLQEVQDLAHHALGVLSQAYPSSFTDSAALLSGVGSKEGSKESRVAWMQKTATQSFTYADALTRPFAWPGFDFGSNIDSLLLMQYEDLFYTRPRGCVLPNWMTDLGTISCKFKLDFGSFRDIQRHRNGVCRMPVLGTGLGFHPWYLEQLDPQHRGEALELITTQTYAIGDLVARGFNQQYLVAMGFQVPCHVTYGLPAVVYVMELRSGKMIHPTLRAVVHKMIRAFQERHPVVKLHVDMDPSDWDARRGLQTIEERR